MGGFYLGWSRLELNSKKCRKCNEDTENERTWCTKCFMKLETKWSKDSKENSHRDPNILLLELTSA